MKTNSYMKNFGRLLILISLIGIAFSFFSICTTWYYKPRIELTFIGIIDTLDDLLINTVDGLDVVDSALARVTENIELVSGTLDQAGSTLDNISGSLGSFSDLIGGDLIEAIFDTQAALDSAAQSAVIIDNTLKFLAAIPLLGTDYRPDIPLGESLGKVSESLDDIPERFLEIDQFIRETDETLGDLKNNISRLSTDIDDFEATISETQALLNEYGLIFDNLQKQFLNIRKQSSTFLLITSILITGGFFLLGFAQINLYQQGKVFLDEGHGLLSCLKQKKNKTID